jgi:hypothetical protein
MVSTTGIAPVASSFARRRSDLTELRGQLALRHKLASVVGLAPTRPGLKTRALELLCIHGQELTPGDWKTRGGCSRAGINLVESGPSMAVIDPLTPERARLVGEERSERSDNRD